jgi:hypothetical protein
MNVKHVQFERKQIGRKEYEIMKTILRHTMMMRYLLQMVRQQLQLKLTIVLILVQ